MKLVTPSYRNESKLHVERIKWHVILNELHVFKRWVRVDQYILNVDFNQLHAG